MRTPGKKDAAGPRDKQVVFAIRAKLGLTPQMDVRPYAYAPIKQVNLVNHPHDFILSLLLAFVACRITIRLNTCAIMAYSYYASY